MKCFCGTGLNASFYKTPLVGKWRQLKWLGLGQPHPSHDGLSLSPPEVVFGVSLVPISEYLVPVAQEGGKYPYSFHDMTFNFTFVFEIIF